MHWYTDLKHDTLFLHVNTVTMVLSTTNTLHAFPSICNSFPRNFSPLCMLSLSSPHILFFLIVASPLCTTMLS